eukprot:463199-Pelagomonas_calceolata.AAC.1
MFNKVGIPKPEQPGNLFGLVLCVTRKKRLLQLPKQGWLGMLANNFTESTGQKSGGLNTDLHKLVRPPSKENFKKNLKSCMKRTPLFMICRRNTLTNTPLPFLAQPGKATYIAVSRFDWRSSFLL